MYQESLLRQGTGGRGRLTDGEYKEDEAITLPQGVRGSGHQPLSECRFSVISHVQKASCPPYVTALGLELFTPIIVPMGQLVSLSGGPILADVPMGMSLSQERRQGTEAT